MKHGEKQNRVESDKYCRSWAEVAAEYNRRNKDEMITNIDAWHICTAALKKLRRTINGHSRHREELNGGR